MHFLCISTPRAGKPSEARGNQKAFWDWLRPLEESGVAKHVYVRLGRGAVIIFDVDSHETMHKLLSQWTECVPASFEVHALMTKDYQEKIARAGTDPHKL